MTGREGPRYRRSPHLLVGWEGNHLVLTHCDTLRRFRVDENLLGLLSNLDDWQTRSGLDAVNGGGPSADVLDRLHGMGVLDRDEVSAGAGSWSPFDLVVQRQQNSGGERAHADLSAPPPPAFKARPPGRVTTLPAARSLEMRLDDVLGARRSLRSYGPDPMVLADLSALLHHSARVTGVVHDADLGDQAFHPYPAGGARSELEVYVVANKVDGLDRGAHWYDARAHELVTVRPGDTGLEAMNEWVADATGGLPRPPHVILLVTAVFERITWKYEGIGLSLVARDVGCLYQTVYLVATALGLAPCAVGAGPELDNDRWLGLEPLVESQVGCVLVGTRDQNGGTP
jgi:SagB-type dehydrogenase family enzyme